MALQLSGSNYFYTQENPGVLDGLSQYTAMCWARPSRLTGLQACFSRQVGTGSGETIWVGFSGANVNTFISLSTTGISVNTGTAVVGQWIHIAVGFRDNPTPRGFIFINGALASSGSGVGTLPATTRGLLVGGNNNGGSPISLADSFQGAVDDLRIYNTLLGPAAISTIAASKGKDGIYAGLLCRYTMFGPDGVTPASIPNIGANPTLNLITQSGNPVFTPGITEARGRPTPRFPSRV